jgi:hypothetical protein
MSGPVFAVTVHVLTTAFVIVANGPVFAVTVHVLTTAFVIVANGPVSAMIALPLVPSWAKIVIMIVANNISVFPVNVVSTLVESVAIPATAAVD